MHFFAIAPRGTESLLAAELHDMGVREVEPRRGGVAFSGSLEAGYRACLWSRVASRVVLPIASFHAPTAEALYDGVHKVNWGDHLGADQTLAVSFVGSSGGITSDRFGALKTKDAIVDAVRDKQGSRPDVDKENPDVRVHVFLNAETEQATVSVDLSGESLHRRGARRTGGIAPLKENLAAAMLMLADWPRWGSEGAPLLDPMCGSGTLLIEAVWMVRDAAPGFRRARFGFEGWRGHDGRLWQRLRKEATERSAEGARNVVSVYGSDASQAAIKAATENARDAGVLDAVHLRRAELNAIRRPESAIERQSEPRGILITNPPYGERIGEVNELGFLYATLGDVLKHEFPGWSAWILSGNRDLDKRLGLRPKQKHVLMNGPIECRLLEVPIADTRISKDSKPGWRKASGESDMLRNRIRKNLRRLESWRKEHNIECYRVYDRDIPEYNVSIDRWKDVVRVEEREAPYSVDPKKAARRLEDAITVTAEELGVRADQIIVRVRRRRDASKDPYERRGDAQAFREVNESDLRFLVNLEDYLDTGLFLDERKLRSHIRKKSEGSDFLNLFAYTCAATVYAAAGHARTTTSVDTNSTYLEWGERNMALNGFKGNQHRMVREDVLRFIQHSTKKYDLIYAGVPTYSKNKTMQKDWDVERDHGFFIRDTVRLLKPQGTLWFITNARAFELHRDELSDLRSTEITRSMVPFDFDRDPPPFRAFLIQPREA